MGTKVRKRQRAQKKLPNHGSHNALLNNNTPISTTTTPNPSLNTNTPIHTKPNQLTYLTIPHQSPTIIPHKFLLTLKLLPFTQKHLTANITPIIPNIYTNFLHLYHLLHYIIPHTPQNTTPNTTSTFIKHQHSSNPSQKHQHSSKKPSSADTAACRHRKQKTFRP